MGASGWLDQWNDPVLVFRWSAGLLGLGQVIATLELLSVRSELGAGGLYSWRVLRTTTGVGTRRRLLDGLFDGDRTARLLVLRLALAALLVGSCVGSADLLLSGLATLLLTAVLVAFQIRLPWGLESADNLSVHLGLGLSAFVLCRSAGTDGVGLLYIAAYAGLAYLTAGLAKLSDRAWRSGEAIGWILNLESFGRPGLEQLLRPYPGIERFVARMVILLELALPLAVLAPAPVAVGLLAAGFVFHVALSWCMGLNTFVWSFTATYPAIALVWTQLHPT